MLRVICVRTGDKYNQWYEDNLKHMVDTYSGLDYDEFVCIHDDVYDDERGVFNKLQMFDKFRDGQNIYFDLDIIIRDGCNNFLRKDFTLCHAWWREPFHTPLNSSIVSWFGDASHVIQPFLEDPDYCLFKYNRGIDQYIYENVNYKTYTKDDGYCSYQTVLDEQDYAIYLFNQRYQEMQKDGWYSNYML
jgi:hypothetical protein